MRITVHEGVVVDVVAIPKFVGLRGEEKVEVWHGKYDINISNQIQ